VAVAQQVRSGASWAREVSEGEPRRRRRRPHQLSLLVVAPPTRASKHSPSASSQDGPDEHPDVAPQPPARARPHRRLAPRLSLARPLPRRVAHLPRPVPRPPAPHRPQHLDPLAPRRPKDGLGRRPPRPLLALPHPLSRRPPRPARARQGRKVAALDRHRLAPDLARLRSVSTLARSCLFPSSSYSCLSLPLAAKRAHPTHRNWRAGTATSRLVTLDWAAQPAFARGRLFWRFKVDADAGYLVVSGLEGGYLAFRAQDGKLAWWSSLPRNAYPHIELRCAFSSSCARSSCPSRASS